MVNPLYSKVLDLLLSSFPKKSKLSILDYGCGDGLFLEYLPKKSIKYYQGCDINEKSINTAIKKFKKNNIKFLKIDKNINENFSGGHKFDAIILIGVLPYMSKKEIINFFSEAKKKLKKEGVIIITCASSHFIYKVLNIYRLFLKHSYVDSKKLKKLIKKSSFTINFYQEKGLLLTPLFSNVFIVFLDALDKFIFKTKGSLGPIGKLARSIMNPITYLEYLVPINFGYTFFLCVSYNNFLE